LVPVIGAFAFPLAYSVPVPELSAPLEEMVQIIGFAKSTMKFSAPILTGVKSEEMRQLTQVEETRPSLSGRSCSAISALYDLNTTRIKTRRITKLSTKP
jgi:hypothetical protein